MLEPTDRIGPDVTLYRGDCLDVLPQLPPASVDVVVTDPPYFVPATHYATRSGTARSLTDLGILEHYFAAVFAAVRRVLKPTGFLYVFCDGQSYPVFYVTAYPHFRRVRPLIWDKQTSINGYAWRHQHELILFGDSEQSPQVPTGDGDVIQCRSVAMDDREHLAQKPVKLLAKLIGKTTPKGGVVLDPFAGSGSTAVAATQCGCSCVLIEKDPAYYSGSVQRVSLSTGAGPGQLFGAFENQEEIAT